MTYCFKCPNCGAKYESSYRTAYCTECGDGEVVIFEMVRDYRAELVGVGTGVRVSRDGTESEIAALFLPDNDEFVGPGDPDGTKGMRKWHETHQPKEGAGDRSMVPGRITRRSF